MTSAMMFQGTGSNVGKSLIVAGLCRALQRRGLTVRPFKPQNMSNNAAATFENGEIGRAQALQALACGCEPTVHMNPVLLKPESEKGAQVIVQGERYATLEARDYMRVRQDLLVPILESFHKLFDEADIVLIEGAGSPAEINLREGDIANMGFAERTGVPVTLIGDIHRGGVIASIVGTLEIISPADQEHIKGFLVNQFRGDPRLFDDGVTYLETRLSRPCFGVIPHFEQAHLLPAEDAVDLDSVKYRSRENGQRKFKIAVPKFSRIANFDDLDPLKIEPGVDLVLVRPGVPFPNDADLILLPGTKSTIAELEMIRREGWDIDISAHIRQGKPVLGICGGFQLLGNTIADPNGIEGPSGTVPGLGFLDVDTVLHEDKTVNRVDALYCPTDTKMSGYQIHLGQTTGPDTANCFAKVNGEREGAVSASGRVMGTYLHGAFAGDEFRRSFLSQLGVRGSTGLNYRGSLESTLNNLAEHLENTVKIDDLLTIAENSTRFRG